MKSAPADLATARAALERVLAGDADARRAQLEPLEGGTHRRSWLVTFFDGRRAVLRLPQANSNALLDVSTEARAMNEAAAAGIAPAVVAVDAEARVLLTDYRAGVRWTAADVHTPANVGRLVAVLHGLHALPTDLPVFAAERIASRYLGAVPRNVGEPRAGQWGEELATLARSYDSRYAPTAFCHNDLVAANVLDDGELALVDFEYAVRADPLLDLANVAAMNAFDGAEQRTLLTMYRRAEPTPLGSPRRGTADELAELQRLVRMVRLMAWFWALLGDATTDDSSLYAPYLTELAAQLRQE
jgi:thiamine kinase-like enzyme